MSLIERLGGAARMLCLLVLAASVGTFCYSLGYTRGETRNQNLEHQLQLMRQLVSHLERPNRAAAEQIDAPLRADTAAGVG